MAPKTILSGLDLVVPPLTILAICNALMLLLSCVMAAVGVLNWIPVVVFAAVNLLAATALFLAWLQEGRDYLSLKTMLQLPYYVIWKLPMYLGLVKRGAPQVWVRTERPPGTDRGA